MKALDNLKPKEICICIYKYVYMYTYMCRRDNVPQFSIKAFFVQNLQGERIKLKIREFKAIK